MQDLLQQSTDTENKEQTVNSHDSSEHRPTLERCHSPHHTLEDTSPITATLDIHTTTELSILPVPRIMYVTKTVLCMH